MRKLFLLALLVALCAPLALAQSRNDDYNKVEVFAGYSHNRVDVGPSDNDPDVSDIFDEREGYNGFNASITGNLTRYVGLKFDYSYHQRSVGFGADNTTARLHNFLGGVQIKDNSRAAKVKPFGHILAGVAHYGVDLSEFDNDLEDFSDTGFAMALGGGLDVRVHPRVDVRVIQFDYNPMRFDFRDFGASNVPGAPAPTGTTRTLHNFRIGVGAAFH